MKIEQRLVRRSMEDIIHIGEALEKFYNGQSGAVLRAFINGRITEEAKIHYDKTIQLSSDRILGRIEAYQMIIDDIEKAIQDKNQLTAPKEEGNND